MRLGRRRRASTSTAAAKGQHHAESATWASRAVAHGNGSTSVHGNGLSALPSHMGVASSSASVNTGGKVSSGDQRRLKRGTSFTSSRSERFDDSSEEEVVDEDDQRSGDHHAWTPMNMGTNHGDRQGLCECLRSKRGDFVGSRGSRWYSLVLRFLPQSPHLSLAPPLPLVSWALVLSVQRPLARMRLGPAAWSLPSLVLF